VKRLILAIVAGIVVWVIAVSLLNRGLRLALPGYAGAEPEMTFTLTMMAARLTIGALASLIAGVITGWLDRPGGRAAWVVGVILLAAFIPGHVALWHVFPVWYHLTFLVSLVPLTVLGSLAVRRRVADDQRGEAGRPVPPA
jgi:hypothetical protein